MGFPRQEYLSGLPFSSPGDLPDTGIEPASPALAGGFFATEPPGKPAFWGEDDSYWFKLMLFQESTVVLLTLNYKVRKGVEAEKLWSFETQKAPI